MIEKIKNPNTLMNEGPTVIGMMSAIIERGGSLDTAVRDVAKNGPARSATLFGNVVAQADTRQISDIGSGLSEMLSKLPHPTTTYRRSLHMVIAASASSDQAERNRMLKDASEISLNGLKEVGETYSTSLNLPCMMTFGLGIMVPMVLMSILPMLSLGGMFGTSGISTFPVIIITLVIIPLVIMSLVFSIKEKNPFLRQTPMMRDVKYALPLFAIVPMALAIFVATEDITIALVVAGVISGSISLFLVASSVRSEKAREKQEMMLQDSVFELGNRLISGENFETAIVDAIAVRKECSDIAERVARELKMCRGDVCSAINAAIGGISEHISEVFCDIYRCSLKDIRDAGRLAVSIGRQLQDQDTVRKGIRNKLKSMTDMMTGTAAVFAPLVLGMSVTMLEPISKVMEGMDLGQTTAILSIYLVELCVLISILTTYLNGRMDMREIVYKVGIMLPISMIMFTMCSAIGL